MDARSNSNIRLIQRSKISTPVRVNPLLVLAFMLSLVYFAGSIQAQTTDSTSWWNPTTWGADDGSVRESSYFSDSAKKSEDKPLFSLPKLSWPSSDKVATAPVKSSPSMLSKMGQSTKRAWGNTVDFLNPFDDKPAKPVQQGYQPQNTTTKQGPGMFSWMWREETTETPTSVNEFLRQERPKF